jgi:hypothetical protein
MKKNQNEQIAEIANKLLLDTFALLNGLDLPSDVKFELRHVLARKMANIMSKIYPEMNILDTEQKRDCATDVFFLFRGVEKHLLSLEKSKQND